MCIRRETREKARRSLAISPVSKPHTHITYMLQQCTSIVYRGGSRISSKGAHLKKIAPSGGRRENFRGGARAGCAPGIYILKTTMSFSNVRKSPHWTDRYFFHILCFHIISSIISFIVSILLNVTIFFFVF